MFYKLTCIHELLCCLVTLNLFLDIWNAESNYTMYNGIKTRDKVNKATH